MDIPEVNMEELEELKKKNFEERLRFIRMYVKWLKEHRVKVEKIR